MLKTKAANSVTVAVNPSGENVFVTIAERIETRALSNTKNDANKILHSKTSSSKSKAKKPSVNTYIIPVKKTESEEMAPTRVFLRESSFEKISIIDVVIDIAPMYLKKKTGVLDDSAPSIEKIT